MQIIKTTILNSTADQLGYLDSYWSVFLDKLLTSVKHPKIRPELAVVQFQLFCSLCRQNIWRVKTFPQICFPVFLSQFCLMGGVMSYSLFIRHPV